MLKEWCSGHEWCDFELLQVNAWQQQSVDDAFKKLSSLGQGLQEEQKVRNELKEIFGLIDTDGGGSIDKDEFYELMCMVGMGDILTRDEADSMIDEVDLDQSGEVELAEFIEVMTKKAE